MSPMYRELADERRDREAEHPTDEFRPDAPQDQRDLDSWLAHQRDLSVQVGPK